ncbi:hypothetical protein NDU88_006380 [Pleurodeles waltl]|uniref:Uncharacterized protein n=1 Tax=Pleurodeles waltl TaxID=8319 RepID=A0AAV7TDB9_PLEWA|nr:hypothetical protein NDU88_006380 [Pleurodeles waltl]
MPTQSVPPYPEGVFTSETSKPEVHCVPAYHEAHPGDARQREPFRAVARLEKDDLMAVKGRTVNLGGLTWEDAKEDDKSEDSGGPLCNDGPADCNDDDWTRRTETSKAKEEPQKSLDNEEPQKSLDKEALQKFLDKEEPQTSLDKKAPQKSLEKDAHNIVTMEQHPEPEAKEQHPVREAKEQHPEPEAKGYHQ